MKGVWLSMRHEIPAMLKSGGGAIVNTSSGAGVIAFPGVEVYVASKHAVIGLRNRLRSSLASKASALTLFCRR